MPYMGQSKMGQGNPIPVNPSTGQLDINALVGMLVDQRKDYVYDTLEAAARRHGPVSALPAVPESHRSRGYLQQQPGEDRTGNEHAFPRAVQREL